MSRRKRDTLNARGSRPTLRWAGRWQIDTSGKSPALIHHCNFSETRIGHHCELCRRSATNEAYYPHRLMAPSRSKIVAVGHRICSWYVLYHGWIGGVANDE